LRLAGAVAEEVARVLRFQQVLGRFRRVRQGGLACVQVRVLKICSWLSSCDLAALEICSGSGNIFTPLYGLKCWQNALQNPENQSWPRFVKWVAC
jgi:hypothetical protein